MDLHTLQAAPGVAAMFTALLGAAAAAPAAAAPAVRMGTEVVLELDTLVRSGAGYRSSGVTTIAVTVPDAEVLRRPLELAAVPGCGGRRRGELELAVRARVGEGAIELALASRVTWLAEAAVEDERGTTHERSGVRRIEPERTLLWEAWSDPPCRRGVLLELAVSARAIAEPAPRPAASRPVAIQLEIDSVDDAAELPFLPRRGGLFALDGETVEILRRFRVPGDERRAPEARPHASLAFTLRPRILPDGRVSTAVDVRIALERTGADPEELRSSSTRLTLAAGETGRWVVGHPRLAEVGIPQGLLAVRITTRPQ